MRGLSVTVVNLYDSYSHDAPSSWQVHSNLSYLTKAFWAFIFTLRNKLSTWKSSLSLPLVNLPFPHFTLLSPSEVSILWTPWAKQSTYTTVRWIDELKTEFFPQCLPLNAPELDSWKLLFSSPCSVPPALVLRMPFTPCLPGWTYSLLNCGSLTDGNDLCFQDVHIYIKSLTKFSRSSKNLDPCFCS